MGKLGSAFFLIFFNFICSQNTFSQSKLISNEGKTLIGKVIRIIDGDTMEILYQNTPINIRLAHIDCPEKRRSQPFGAHAKKALSDLCFGQNVTVYSGSYDRYKRLIAVVVNNRKQVINREMIKLGLAWHYKQYSTDPLYAELEIEARRKKIGLWSEKHPIAPWAWRRKPALVN